MSRTIRLLRHTARLLLVLTPLTLLTGFLAAKWFVAEGCVSPATVHAWHVRWLPLAFVPVVFVHSLSGILFLLQRNKRFDRPWVRGGAAALWTIVLGVFVWLYLAQPPTTSAPVALESGAEPGDDAGTVPAAPADAATAAVVPAADAEPAPQSAATSEVAADASSAEAAATIDATATDVPGTAESSSDAPPSPPELVVSGDARTARGAAADEARRAEALLQQRCTSCHGLDQVRNARHDAAGWAASIDRMVGHGATVSSRERALLVRHLARR